VTTPKLPPPPANRPEEVWVFAFVGGDESAVGEDDVGFHQIVDG
jgi:hypothetical protein